MSGPRPRNTERDAEILAAVARGEPYTAIADRYGIDPSRISQIKAEARKRAASTPVVIVDLAEADEIKERADETDEWDDDE